MLLVQFQPMHFTKLRRRIDFSISSYKKHRRRIQGNNHNCKGRLFGKYIVANISFNQKYFEVLCNERFLYAYFSRIRTIFEKHLTNICSPNVVQIDIGQIASP